MNSYVKSALVVVSVHMVRWVSEYFYYVNCCGFVNSVFAWGSPTCRALRWVSESASTKIVGVFYGVSKIFNI
jgi:hypothetical protein